MQNSSGFYQKPKQRILYFDLLNIAACFAVVVLHCNGAVHGFSSDAYWWQALIAEVVFFWAVPVFFMLTGANNIVYRKKRTTKEFLLRRMRRLLVPFLFWSMVAYIANALRAAEAITFIGFYEAFMANSIVPIYWFFPAVISLTFAMPVLSLLLDSRRILWYIVLLQFCLGSVLPYIAELMGIAWSSAFMLPVANNWVMYALIGYLLSTTALSRRQRVFIYLLGILALSFRYSFTYLSSFELGVLDQTLFSYGAFTGVLPSVAIFTLFKYAEWERTPFVRCAKIVSRISQCSFGIYLIHIFILNELVIGYMGFDIRSIFVRVAGPFVVYLLSLAVVFLLQKIPIVREVIP